MYYIADLLYAFARESTRIAFTLFYLRIFTLPGARRVIMVTLAVNALLGVVFVFVLAFQCTPVSYYWTQSNPGQVSDKGPYIPTRASSEADLSFTSLDEHRPQSRLRPMAYCKT